VTPGPLPTVCAWCERVRTGAGRWEKREGHGPASEATHGICPDCLAEVEHTASLEAGAIGPLTRADARPLP
jgi:hypothetical protein